MLILAKLEALPVVLEAWLLIQE
jgi:hypothetical protein